jgi:hypothetical protein
MPALQATFSTPGGTSGREARNERGRVSEPVPQGRPVGTNHCKFLSEAVLICFRLQMQLLHKKSLICTKTLGSIGAMMSTSQRSGLEFRFERGVSLGLKSFIARLDEFRTGVAL